MSSYITEKKSSTMLDQIHKNNLNVKCRSVKLHTDLSAAIIIHKFIFPYPIRVLSLGLSPASAPTGAVDIDIAITPGSYQEFGLTGKSGGDATGLSGTTQYYWKVDGVEYNITTAADMTFTAVIALMEAAMGSGYVVSLTGGDIRITSVYKTIAITAGTTGTDLLVSITGTSIETAVSSTTYTTISVTQPNASATATQEKENTLYAANTVLTIACNSAIGSNSENITFQMHYVIEQSKLR